MLNPVVDFEEDADAVYPDRTDLFCPSELYPEYPWSDSHISSSTNYIYKMVRDAFISLGYDSQNVGTRNWNPLKDIISENDVVLLKPNMVVSEHTNLDCIVTHPSIVRVVLDYVFLALNGTGKVIIGDAPMKRCVFNDVVTGIGYDALISFYRKKGLAVELIDFRSDDENDFICCDVGADSFLCETDKYYKRYRVTSFDYRLMRKYHNKNAHRYLIRREVLEANVIISLPKLKTHKKAGITGACKNFVGTVSNKACLPHHIRGSVQSGGNEYLHTDFFKTIRTICNEQIDLCNIYGKQKMLPFWEKFLYWSYRMINRFSSDPYSEGSWYGNDTIWRTFGDIDRIILYADKEGCLHDFICRKLLIVGDMIVSGEKEGPVHADPKKQGMIVAGCNPVAFDCLEAKIMGFQYDKIPALKNLIKKYRFEMFPFEYKDIVVNSKSNNIREKRLFDMDFNSSFVPASGWKNHIEIR